MREWPRSHCCHFLIGDGSRTRPATNVQIFFPRSSGNFSQVSTSHIFFPLRGSPKSAAIAVPHPHSMPPSTRSPSPLFHPTSLKHETRVVLGQTRISSTASRSGQHASFCPVPSSHRPHRRRVNLPPPPSLVVLLRLERAHAVRMKQFRPGGVRRTPGLVGVRARSGNGRGSLGETTPSPPALLSSRRLARTRS